MDQRYSFLGFPEKLDPWQRFLPYALLLSVTFALYGTTLFFNFAWDDSRYVVDNYWIQGWSLDRARQIWTSSFLGNYAPLHHTVLAVLHSLSGLDPFGYHLAQLLLHASCVCLLYFVLKRIESARIALLASLFFAVFPPNVENVAWISETKSTLALGFFLLSFWFFQRLRTRERWTDGAWCAVFLVLSLLSKISTVVAPAIFLLYDYRQGSDWKKSKVWSLACFFLISAVFGGIHLVSAEGTSGRASEALVEAALTDIPPPSPGETSGYFGGVAVHFLNLPHFLLFYIRMVLFPDPLSAWQIVRVFGELEWTTGAAWIALFGLLWLLYRSPRPLQFWMLWFFVFLTPVLQLIPNPIWVADRYLYLPAIGAFVLGSKLFFCVFDRMEKLWLRLGWEAGWTAVLLAFAWQTHHYLPVWRNDLTLWEYTAKTCVPSAFCHYKLGKALLLYGHSERGVNELFQAVQIRQTPLYLTALGDAYMENTGDYQRALLAYGMAQQSGTVLPLSFLANVAKTYYLSGDLEQAGRVIESGQKIQADNSSLLLVQGFVQWKQGSREEARRSLQKVLVQNAVNPLAASPPKFLSYFWGQPVEVGRLLADLGPL